MATVIDELMVTLGLDGSEAKQGMREIEGSMGSFVDSIKGKILGIGGAFAGLYAVQQTFSNYLNEADSLLKFSRAIGQNVEDIDAWGQAVKRSGGTAEGFQASLKTLTTQLSKMSTTGNSRAGKILESVGIDAGSIGRARDSFEVLQDIADKMQGMSKQEAFGFGASLGLDQGTIMLLQQGRDGVADLVGKMKELGTITPDDGWVEDFNDSIDDIKKSFMSLMGIIFREVGPVFNWLTQQVKQLNIWLRKHETAVKAFFYMVAGLITALLIPTILELFAVLLANPITWIVMLLAGLALAIEDLVVWADGGESALGDLWEAIFGSPEEAKQTFADIQQALNDIWETIKPLAKAFLEFYKSLDLKDKALFNMMPVISLARFAVEAFVNWINEKLTELAQWIDTQFEEVGNYVNSVWQSICDFVDGVLTDIETTAKNAFDNMMNKANNVVESIKGFFVGLKETIISAIGEAIDWAIGKLANLAAAIKATPIIGGAVDFVTGGSGNTTNVNQKVDVVVNGAKSPQDTANAVRGAMKPSGYGYQYANGGVR